MKVTIVQKQLFPYFGVMAVAGALKAAGHQVQALIELQEPDIVDAVKGAIEGRGATVPIERATPEWNTNRTR